MKLVLITLLITITSVNQCSANAEYLVLDNVVIQPSYFNHKAHSETIKECVYCHHKENPGAEERCGNCHKRKIEGKKLEFGEAYHKTCKTCHWIEKRGPTNCEGCHRNGK